MFKSAINNLTLADVTVISQGARDVVASAKASASRAAPSNAELLVQMRQYYKTHELVIDGTAAALDKMHKEDPDSVKYISEHVWTDENKNPKPILSDAMNKCKILAGTFSDVIDAADANTMFTTVGVGAGVDAQFLVGGAGGVGATWDLLNREPEHGYAYALVEMGLRINASINVQGLFMNRLPSKLTQHVLALKVSAVAGFGPSLTIFWSTEDSTFDIIGFATGLEFGGGAGATISYGKIWQFT